MVIFNFILIVIINATIPLKVGSNRLIIFGLILTLFLIHDIYLIDYSLFNNYITLSKITIFLLILTLLLSLIIFFINYKQINTIGSLYLLSILGTIFLIISNNLIGTILALELQSFTIYLINSLSEEPKEDSQSLKYLILGAISSGLIIIGTSLLYYNTGTLDYETLFLLNDSKLSLIIILLGCLLKLAVAPLHQWAPDLYSSIYTKTIIYVSLIPKIGVLSFLTLFILPILDNDTLLISFISITLIVGSIGGLIQFDYRKILAYSSTAHIGYLLIASYYLDNFNFIFYLIQYTITTIFILYLLSIIDRKINGNIKDLSIYNYYFIIILSLILFSLAGIPPLIGFFAKLNIFYGLLNYNIFLVLVAIVTSVISSFYYLRLINLIINTNSLNYSIHFNINKIYIVSIITLFLLSYNFEGTLLEQILKYYLC